MIICPYPDEYCKPRESCNPFPKGEGILIISCFAPVCWIELKKEWFGEEESASEFLEGGQG